MDNKQEINNKEAQYAGFWLRLAALLLDGIVLNALLSFGFLFFHQKYGVFNVNANAFSTILSSNPQNVIALVVQWIYSILMLKYFGATLGKMAVRIRVVSTEGELDWVSIILRESVGKALSSIILFIGYFMVAWDPKKQALHDKIAGTLVIRE